MICDHGDDDGGDSGDDNDDHDHLRFGARGGRDGASVKWRHCPSTPGACHSLPGAKWGSPCDMLRPAAAVEVEARLLVGKLPPVQLPEV
eukprot:1150117-Pelagomonas_calceolata.AAC.7